jgi:suppressor of G2 allele of SKP1
MSRVVSAEDALKTANSLFVDENFEGALENYDLAISLDDSAVDAYLKRSQCHIKLQNFTDALADAQKAISLAPNNAKAYFRKGIACFELEEFETALAAFEKGSALDTSDSSFKSWIRKCKAEIESEGGSVESSSSTPVAAPKPTTAETKPPATVQAQTSNPAPQPAQPAQSAQPAKIRHEWYQSASHVVVTVFAKNVKREDLTVDIQKDSLSVSIKLSADNQYVLDLDLADEVSQSESGFDVTPSKVEIKLKKANPVKWNTLERTADSKVHAWDSTVSNVTSKPPAASKKNWDKIVKEEVEEEKPDGEAGLNKVFQDIYSNASDEQKRAMMKSFLESGGTVLSTNWDEVGKGEVKGSPPAGMEMRKWEH